MALLSAVARIHSRALHAPVPFEVVSNDGEMDLALCFGEADPSHATKTVTAFPGAEDFLDPATDRPQRPIMRFERFGGALS